MKNTQRKLLIVDDDKEIQDLMVSILNVHGYSNVIVASSLFEARIKLHEQDVDLIILDIMLGDGTGFELLEEIRSTSNIPVLFVSALSDIEQQYKGFSLGGDDYITKPFVAKELIMRVTALLRRTYMEDEKELILGNTRIAFDEAVVKRNDEIIQLTAKEFQILSCLFKHKNRIVSKDQILDDVWKEESFGYENSLMAHIRKIREKIEEDPSSPKYLLTIKGLGYKLKVVDE